MPTPRIDEIESIATLPPDAQIQRYAQAVRAYLLALLRGSGIAEVEDAAHEVFLRLLPKFRACQLLGWAGKGRFRDYLKTVVRNQAIDYLRSQTTQKRKDRLSMTSSAGLAQATTVAETLDLAAGDSAYRKDLFDNSLKSLKAENEAYYLAVKWLKDEGQDESGEPGETTSQRLAVFLTQQTGQTYAPNYVRVVVGRARRRFAERLVQEVKRTLENATPELVEEELAALNLLSYLRPFLPPDWRTRGELSEEES